MRIGCLQFAPQVGDVNNNLNRADSVLSKANPDDLDLLVLPELAFSGYNFKSLQDIAPFLEYSGSGITSLWARTVALKYNCVVTVGYPEKVDLSAHWPANPEYYNSTIVVNAEGETIANYRKSFLYYTDESWALEGDEGFFEGYITGLGNTSIGICMDLNPYKYEAPWEAFEFAFHVLEAGSNLVIVSMAWMTREEPRKFTRMPNEPDMETLTYWVTRLEPLIRQDSREEIIVVFCNRCGNEEEVLYAGTSAVIGILDGEVRVYGLLGRGERDLLVVDTNDKPHAKLVQRPETGRKAVIEVRGKPREQERQDRGNETDETKSSDPEANAEQQDSTQLLETHGNRDSEPSQPKAAAHPFDRELPLRSRLYQKPPSEHIHTTSTNLPQQLDLEKFHSLRSPGLESLSVPTPSAPSPTPLALRPRLIIPESPQSAVHLSPQGSPPTATSLRSDRSLQSIDSAISGASTIRSNHRPPEDSTPYPDSAIPTAHPSGFSKLMGQLSVATDGNSLPSSSRAASRGRTPGPRKFPPNEKSREVFKSPLRSPSTDSTRNEVLHSRIEHPGSSRQSRSRRTSTRHQSRHRSRGGDNFERFEAIVCPTCPVHGRSSSNGAQSVPIRLTVDSLPQRGHSADPLGLEHGTHSEQDIPQPVQGLDGLEMLRRYQEDQSECVLTPASNFSEVFGQSDRSSSAATWDTSSPERSPSTPAYFNPAQTPRAMVFATDDSEIDALPSGGLNGDTVSSKVSGAPEQSQPIVTA
ncbi:hypothetical protein IL306_010908 [Fusarium sp. DS 682]|nr:hypothetical protein IL306_010908 [Fusarium sp. DS 682]